MHINVKTSGEVLLTEELRSFVNEKLAKLEDLLDPKDSTVMADVELESKTRSQRTGNIHRAEINLRFKGGFVRAEASRESMHSAIDEAVDEARSELRKRGGKRRDLVRRGAARIKDFLRKFGA